MPVPVEQYLPLQVLQATQCQAVRGTLQEQGWQVIRCQVPRIQRRQRRLETRCRALRDRRCLELVGRTLRQQRRRGIRCLVLLDHRCLVLRIPRLRQQLETQCLVLEPIQLLEIRCLELE